MRDYDSVSVHTLYLDIISKLDMYLLFRPNEKVDLILEVKKLVERLLNGEGFGEENEVNAIKSK